MSAKPETNDDAGHPRVSAKDWLEHYRHDLQHMAVGNGHATVVNDPRALCVRADGHDDVLQGVVFAVDDESFDLAAEPGPSTYYSQPRRLVRIFFVDIVEMWLRVRDRRWPTSDSLSM
jgi:hypothetical protein